MWVNEILPPRLRLSWLLMTIRLSIISLAGMARTLVAVGTSRDADMFLTPAAAAPRSTCNSSPSAGATAAAFGAAGAVASPLPAVAGPAAWAGAAGAAAGGGAAIAGFASGAASAATAVSVAASGL